MQLDTLIDDSPFFSWIKQNGQALLLSLGAIFTLIVACLLFFTGSSKDQLSIFLQADKDFFALQKLSLASSSEKWDFHFKSLEKAMNDHPELQSKYDGLLAELLLIQGHPEQAKNFSSRVFERIKKHGLPFYSSFAKISFLISEKKYEEALKKTEDLHEQMTLFQEHNMKNIIAKEFGSSLFAQNLFRLAYLYDILGQSQQAKEIWNQFSHSFLSANSSQNKKELQMMLSIFEEKNTTLSDFISEKTKVL